MKIIFMGSSNFSLPSLEALIQAGHEVPLVVTQPDRRGRRGNKLVPTPVKQWAVKQGRQVFSPQDVNGEESLARFRQLAPQVIVVVAFGQKLSPALLQLPGLGCVNVHASLLPKYRGAAPVHRAIIKGETETGISIISMTEQLDAGEILAQEPVPIGREQTAGELQERLARRGAGLLCKVLDGLARGSVSRLPQDISQVSFAPKLKKSDLEIDWNRLPVDVFNLIRGLSPSPGAYTWLHRGRHPCLRVTILGSRLVDEGQSDLRVGRLAGSSEGILVGCRKGKLLVTKLKPAGARQMSAGDYLRGNPLGPDDAFIYRQAT